MSPLPILRRGFWIFFLYSLISSVIVHAQQPEDLQKMGKEADGFQYKLKFFQPGGPSLEAQKTQKIQALLDQYNQSVPAELKYPFQVKGESATQPPALSDGMKTRLMDQTQRFFQSMSAQGITLWDLQKFRSQYKGNNPANPELAWATDYQVLERTLMGGRTLMVMNIWQKTLVEFFRNNPDAVGVIYGQMDIGSWVKMSVDGLGFPADIDFSTLATDPATNKKLQQLFETNLKAETGLRMVPIDVVLTPHGLAGADVFIGEWGKTFAEVDMVRRGKWKLMYVERNEAGQVTEVVMKEREGKELFMEQGKILDKKTEKVDPNNFDPREKYPELKIDMEPMLSLEMLRHGMHDVEHGPFSGGQKIIKMIKYTERSYFMMNEVSKNLAESGTPWNYDPDPDPGLKAAAEAIIKNKNNMPLIVSELERLTGKKLESRESVDAIVEDITRRCKNAMLANAKRAFGFRVLKIAQMTDEGQRFDEADRMLRQLNEEFTKGYGEGGTEIPKTMLRAHTLLVDLRAGKLSPDQMNVKLEELNKLMADEYKIDQSWTERIIGDAWSGVNKWLEKKGYGEEFRKGLIEKFKNKFKVDWRSYVPEWAETKAISTYEFAGRVQQKLNVVNDMIMKTKAGKIISSDLLNHVDNFFAVYDALMSGKDWKQSVWRASTTVVTIAAQTKWPGLAIPLGFYNAYQSGSPKPAIMAVAFYMFPAAGQIYMATSLLDRIVISNVRDMNFHKHLSQLGEWAVVENNKLVRLRVLQPYSDLAIGAEKKYFDSDDIPTTEPARSAALSQIFDNPELPVRPEITYFRSLVPKRSDQFGMYETKMENLKTLFSFDPEMAGYIYSIQEFVKNELPDDEMMEVRRKVLDSLQYSIETMMWISIGNAIESMKVGENPELRKYYDDIIQRLEDSCFMDDYRMKKIDSMGLATRIQYEIRNDTYIKQSQGNVYAQGTAFGRIAVPIYEKYIRTYRRINEIREEIFKIWQEYGVNTSAIQQDPLRLLLMGSTSGAPMLTGNPDKDMQSAISCLDAHVKRAAVIRLDLVNALGRPYDEKTDKEHLRILSQFGFEFEHLVDANPDGRSPGFTDKAGTIAKAMTEKSRLYKAYLEKIKEGPPLNITIKVEGENETTETNPVTFKVILLNEKKQVVPLPAGTTLEWHLYDETARKEVKVAEGAQFTHDAAKQGSFSYTIRLNKKANNKTTLVASQYWHINVKRFDATHPTKGIVLKAPSVIKQYEIFDVSFTLPAALKGRELKCNWGYSTIGKNDDCSGAKMQYNFELTFTGKDGKKVLRDSTTVDAYITVLAPGKTYGEVYQVTKKVKYQHMSINVKASEIWTGGSGPNWFRIDRKPISNPPRYADWMNDPTRRARSTATAYATVGLKDDEPFGTINTLDDLKALMDKEAKELAYRKLEVKPVSVGDFKGYGLYSEPRYSRGSWSIEGYTPAGAGASFSGYVMKGKKIFEVYWNAGAGGAFDNSDQGWMMSMVKQLATEAEGILTAASFQPDGRLTKTPYTGPKLDGSDFPQVSIEPKVDTVLPGTKVTVRAVIKNDKPEYGPYTYSWSGNMEGGATGSSAQLEAGRPGKKTISVNVDGTTPPGSASMEYVVAPVKVKLVKTAPAGNKVLAGAAVELKAEFTGPVPAGSKLLYRWQPHPEEKFQPFEGTGNSTKVQFTKPGIKKIWVQVLDKTTSDVYTLGESDQLELEVISPSFTISLTPSKAVVGQWVTAKVSSGTRLEDIDYRWTPLPDNATLVKESPAGDEIIFYAKNTSPVALQVQVREKGNAVQLGEAKASFVAEHYKISVEGPKVQGPKPMIWKPGVGLVEVEKEIAVHQIVEFSAVVNPRPESEITYNWQIIEGNASISNPASRDARITALETGQVQARVTVKDKNGVELGSSSGVFNATISNEMISNGKEQKKLFDEKMQLARKYLQEGKLDEAVKLGLEVKGMNAKDAAPLLNELGAACKKDATTAASERDFEKAIKRCNQALELNPDDGAAKKQLEEIKKWAQEWTTVNAKGTELEGLVNKKDLPAAEKALAELYKLQQNMPGKTDNKYSRDKAALFNALVKSCDSAYAITQKNSAQSFSSNDFEGCAKELESFRSAFTPRASTQKEIETLLQQCKNKIAEQKKVYADYQQLKARFEQGQPIDPMKGPEYLEATAINTFSKKDPRQQEVIDFARVMKNKQKETTDIKARAEKLKAEGQTAEESGDTETAIRKYKESIALVPDPELEAYIRILETKEVKPPLDPDIIRGTWATNADAYKATVGKQYRFYFPPGGNLDGSLWGTDIYTTDGSIAKAAVHAGLITVKDGGTVTIEIRPGQPAYRGSTRNGVTSQSWTAYEKSFIFITGKGRPEEVDPAAIVGNWNTQANREYGKRYKYYFPPNGTISSRVWGTDIYTYDCSIASAAVHAGIITVKDGGYVTIEIIKGQPSYKGSTRNGVTSRDYGPFDGSFIFVKDGTTKPPEEESKTLKLVAWYPFNGNARDESGLNRHGTLRNGVTLAKDRFDKENSAFYFDGADDYIEFSASGLPAKDRTVMFWLKPAPGNQPSYPLTYGGGTECGSSFLMGFNAEGSKRFNTQGHCRTNFLYNDPWIMDPANQWRHFTVTISGNTIKIYLNGILMKSNNGFTNPTMVEGKKLIVGGLVGPEGITPYRDASGGYFKGILDDIRIYRGAMTDEQVRTAVAEQQPGTVKEPVKEDKGVNPADTEKEKKVFENGNIGGVSSGPPNPTKITFTTATFITRIENYHYFNRGAKPGTIGLRHNNGTMYGPWQAYGLIGQGGVQNAYWVVLPNLEVPAGTYTVIDSDPSTWSYNSQSGGCGFTTVWTEKTRSAPVTTTPDKGVNPADPKTEKKVFENGNIGGVSSGPPNPTKITFNTPTFITRIENYHYFNRGVKPGTIGLRHSNGTMYGPWQAYGLVGQGGVQNAYWDVLPNIEVPAGTYTVIDSDPPTWSYNSQSGGCGFTTVWTALKGTTTDKETWKGIFNVVWGVHAELQLVNGRYTGRMSVGGGSWETMEELVIRDNKVSFHRVNGNQYYTGTISGNVMKGTFTSGGRTGQNYDWELRREGAAISGNPPAKPGYTIEEVGGGVSAEQICIAGDIDNLGFGFPKGFDVFSGNSTPSHGYPWKIDPKDAMGTDRIMVGSGSKGNSDGYSGSTTRPDNMPVPITLGCNVTGINIRAAVLQLFVDDFQAPYFGSVFSATINGRKAPFLETVLNSLSQTGPIGKLISVNIPAEFLNEVKSGQLKLFIDDATSGRGDGFAIDFVRLVINPSSYTYTGTITGVVKRPDGQPAAGAVISAGGIISTTANNAGEFTLKNVPAGMVTVHASYNNHHHININADLASGKTIKITINLPVD